MSQHLLAYLSRYATNPKIVSLNQFDFSAIEIPESWVQILSFEGKSRVSRALDYWHGFSNLMPELVSKLSETVLSIELLESNGEYSLLYEVASPNKSLCYEAKNPIARNFSNNISMHWEKLPDNIKRFYDFHDGWFYLASHSMGLSCSKDVFVLSDEDWGVLEEIDTPPIDMDKTISFFTNGTSGYVCLDLTKNNPELEANIWWSNKSPTLDVDFWGVVDAWTTIGIEG